MRRLLLICLLLTGLGWSLPLEDVPNPLTAHDSWFSDTVGVMKEDSILALDDEIDRLEEINGTQIAIVTIANTSGKKPKTYATQLFNRWGVGEAEINNGVLVLVVMEQRRIEIEVGDGANRYLTNARCKQILQNHMIPHFKSGKPDRGIAAGVRAIIGQLEKVDYSQPPPVAEAPVTRPAPQPVARHHRPQRSSNDTNGWVLGGFGALAFGGFLGLRRYLRNRPRKCPGCKREMDRLGEIADDAFLDAGQKREEDLGSIDYDVWVCRRCDEQKILAYPKWFSGFSKCPSCKYKCLESESTTITSATTYSEGRGRRDDNCRHCSYSHTSYYTIPKIEESSSSSSSSFSSSSSSGFGGGSSSGGGAGGSW